MSLNMHYMHDDILYDHGKLPDSLLCSTQELLAIKLKQCTLDFHTKPIVSHNWLRMMVFFVRPEGRPWS